MHSATAKIHLAADKHLSECSSYASSAIEGCISSGEASYIGWTSSIGSGLDYMSPGVQVFGTTYGTWIPLVIVSTRFRCSWPTAPALSADSGWTFAVSEWPHSGHAHSRTLAQPSGTYFLSISQIQTPSEIFPLLLLPACTHTSLIHSY